MVDEHDIEATLGRVCHQPLELCAAIGAFPARVEVAVVLDELELVLFGEATDRFTLCVG